ncbi:MAG: hypothetical protein KC609_14295 [Myxococcales bacterium]|nr:hypothetical protein [Myxococcales bacterium]
MQEALDRPTSLTTTQRFTAYKTLAFSLAAVDREREAAAAFRRALEIDERFSLDPKVVAPRIYRAFRTALEAHLQARRRPDPAIHWPSKTTLLVPLPIPTPQLAIRKGFARTPTERESMIGLELGAAAGALFLFGNDHGLYDHGGEVSLRIGYRPHSAWLVGFSLSQSFHRSSDSLASSLEGASSTTLLILRLHLFTSWRFFERRHVTLDAEIGVGVALFGLGDVSGNVGVSAWAGLAAAYRINRTISLVLRIAPALLSAPSRSDESGGFGHSILLALTAGAEFSF